MIEGLFWVWNFRFRFFFWGGGEKGKFGEWLNLREFWGVFLVCDPFFTSHLQYKHPGTFANLKYDPIQRHIPIGLLSEEVHLRGFSFLAPDWLFSCKTITFLRCFKCSRFSQSQCKFPDKREMLLFLTTNMAAVMSRAMQQFENSLKIRGSAWKFGMGFLGGLIVGPGFLWGSVGSPMSRNFFTSMFSCIRSSPSLETRSTPPPPPLGYERVNWTTNCWHRLLLLTDFSLYTRLVHYMRSTLPCHENSSVLRIFIYLFIFEFRFELSLTRDRLLTSAQQRLCPNELVHVNPARQRASSQLRG